MQYVVIAFFIYVLCSIVLLDCVWTSCNNLALRAEVNSWCLQAWFRKYSLTFWHCARHRHFKYRSQPATLLKKRLLHRCFPVNFAKFIIKPFLTEHLWWLFLTFTSFLPGKLLSVKIHGQTLTKQSSLFQNIGIKQRHVDTRIKVELAINYMLLKKQGSLKVGKNSVTQLSRHMSSYWDISIKLFY